MTDVRVKICGITRLDDALQAVELGAWALGFIFFKRSKRYLAPERAYAIINELYKRNSLPSKTFGVFVNAHQIEIAEAVTTSGVSVCQLHGDESPSFCESLPYEYVKALPLKKPQDLAQINSFRTATHILVDASIDGEYGGTGQLADWALAARVKEYKPLILSGGLNASNIAKAIEQVLPYAVDLSSGIEESPGKKSREAMIEFFANVNRRSQP